MAHASFSKTAVLISVEYVGLERKTFVWLCHYRALKTGTKKRSSIYDLTLQWLLHLLKLPL